MRKIVFILLNLSLISLACADDGAGAAVASGGDNSFSGLGGFNSAGSSAGGAGSAAVGVMVPPIVAGGAPQAGSAQSASDAVNLSDNNGDGQGDDSSDQENKKDDETRALSRSNGGGVNSANSNAGYDPFITNVFIRTGLRLKKFGAGMFKTPSSFSPAQNIPVPSNYVIGPGDELRMQSWGAVNANLSSKVRPDGTIFVPKLGEVPVTGVRAGELDGYMKQRLGKIYRNFDLSANVSKIKTIRVSVAGMASRPGTYSLSSLSTLSNAIAAVGGPSNVGSLRNVELKRNGRVIDHFDAYDLLMRGDNGHDVQLIAGDVILFQPLGNEVAIFDGVKRAGIYEIKAGENLKDLVSFAGGYSSEAKTDKVVIETIGNNKAISVNNYATEQAVLMPLSDGAIVHFFKTQNRYENSIAVIGNVAYPTRMGFKSGMHVQDVIPNQEALLTASFYNSFAYNTYGRDNAMTQLGVEKTKAQSSAGGLNMTTGLQSNQNQSNAANQIFSGGQNLFMAGPVAIPASDINWNYALIVRVDPETFASHIIPFNLKKAIAGDPANNLALEPGDIINVLSAKDVRTATAGGSIYVFVDGEVLSPGVYELKNGQSLRDVIESAGGVSEKAYVFGTELTRDSVKKQQAASLGQMLDQAQQSVMAQASTATSNVTSSDQAKVQSLAIQQQLGFIDKMRQIKPSGRVVLNLGSGKVKVTDLPDFKLENGDTVYIPPRPDTVNVVGQVYNPATFMYKADYTVGDYIGLAGTENQFADPSSEYVLRADGTLYSKQQAGWFGGFTSRSLNPGDVVIVPQQIQIGGMVQNIMNWTQILANTAQTVVLFNR